MDMAGLQLVDAGQVGDGPAHLEHSIASPGRKAESFHREPEQVGDGGGLRTEAANLSRGERRVGMSAPARTATALPLPRGFHSLANGPARFASGIGGEIAEGERADLEVQVNPIQQRP